MLNLIPFIKYLKFSDSIIKIKHQKFCDDKTLLHK